MTAEEFRCHLIRTYLNTKKERRPVRGGRASSVPFGGNNVMEGGVQSRARAIAPFQRSLKLYLLISPIRVPYRLPQLIGA